MESKPLSVLLRKFAFQDVLSEVHDSFLDQGIDAEQGAAKVRLLKIGAPAHQPASIPGYFVMSSAPPNIETAEDMQASEVNEAKQGVREIAQYLYDVYTRSDDVDPELMIAVHGYNSGRSSVRDWYKKIFQYINRYDKAIPIQGNQVFIGYRWPSENIELQRLGEACKSLPPLPRALMFLGFGGALILLVLELMAWDKTWWGWLVVPFLTLLLSLAVTVGTLVLLRMVVYFRDRYRAQNFGVLDLVELLRQIDQAMVNIKVEELTRQHPQPFDPHDKAAQFWKRAKRKIKISFLGHSMGGFVVTNVVRILSDVFDSRSVKNQPPADIGSVFRLERLLLTSPDIPILTIVSSRANFLSSSLRRFSESYLFSNEGDLALRVASATANYFTFPSSSEAMGYRLGNVALKSTYNDYRDYGIINMFALNNEWGYSGSSFADSHNRSSVNVMDYLFLTYNGFRATGYNTIAGLLPKRMVKQQLGVNNGVANQQPQMTIADFFTYFDCTDYKDVTFSLAPSSKASSHPGVTFSAWRGLFPRLRHSVWQMLRGGWHLGLQAMDYVLSLFYARHPDKPRGLLTRAQRKSVLNWWDYLGLMVDGLLGKRDVHGGYFEGKFTQEMIYRIAFLGFSGYLKNFEDNPQSASNLQGALSKLHLQCRKLGIQSFLSPIRYRVNVQGRNIEDNRQELFEAIDQSSADLLKSDFKMMQSLHKQDFDIIDQKSVNSNLG